MFKYDESINQRYGLSLVNDKVVRKEASLNTKEWFQFMEKICEHFICKPDPMVVPIYSFDTIATPTNTRFGTYTYSYTMKRLGMLSNNEKRLIQLMTYARDMRTSPQMENELEEIAEQFPELEKFMKEVYCLDRYHDIHHGNFLVDEEGNYKIIDIEGFIYTPFDRKENNWISR